MFLNSKTKKDILGLMKCFKSRNLRLGAEAATALASLGRTDPLIARRAIPVLEEILINYGDQLEIYTPSSHKEAMQIIERRSLYETAERALKIIEHNCEYYFALDMFND